MSITISFMCTDVPHIDVLTLNELRNTKQSARIDVSQHTGGGCFGSIGCAVLGVPALQTIIMVPKASAVLSVPDSNRGEQTDVSRQMAACRWQGAPCRLRRRLHEHCHRPVALKQQCRWRSAKNAALLSGASSAAGGVECSRHRQSRQMEYRWEAFFAAIVTTTIACRCCYFCCCTTTSASLVPRLGSLPDRQTGEALRSNERKRTDHSTSQPEVTLTTTILSTDRDGWRVFGDISWTRLTSTRKAEKKQKKIQRRSSEEDFFLETS